jgi:transcriptional regulator of nitric oxide reductase
MQKIPVPQRPEQKSAQAAKTQAEASGVVDWDALIANCSTRSLRVSLANALVDAVRAIKNSSPRPS